jgi:hypothetical protein
LDVGGGDGSLAIGIAEELLSRGKIRSAGIVVVDFVDSRVPGAKEIQVDNNYEISTVTGKFDLILLSAILEHIPDVFVLMSKVKTLATNGTVLYGRTPYALPLTRILPRIDIGFPYHVHDMGLDYCLQFPRIYSLDADVTASGPSIVESNFLTHPLRTVVAHLLKAPCYAEMLVHKKPWWRLVGGWEAFLRFR